MNYILSEIYIYPVKSLSGISLQKSEVTERGLKYDRRWMLIDQNNMFITQRKYPKMALIKVDLENDLLIFTHKLNNELQFKIPIEIEDGKLKNVAIWDDYVTALHFSEEADEWFSNVLNLKCKLVYMPDNVKRNVDKKYATRNEIVSFADAFPFLIIGQESLNDLNSRLKEKLPMNRFRPNFVFTGGNAYDEDKWKSFKIGDVAFYPVKPCSRCVITTINHDTAEKSDEPLKTLSTYRAINNKVMFGQNLLHEGEGIIRINDELKILEWK
ncbi:MAG: MOSC domain-containing protein [Melioribacter sp.]|uniref:MOSC domain-containing protein n=1 Tax=Rosettibacter primus TaxID=3111523 RepID=UPI00247ED036|nr:MOSC domain-containing protein [Melioribacter sp.]